MNKEELMKKIKALQEQIVQNSTNTETVDKIKGEIASLQNKVDLIDTFKNQMDDMQANFDKTIADLRKSATPTGEKEKEAKAQYKKDIQNYMKSATVTDLLRSDIDSEGGLFVPDEFSQEIIRLATATSAIASLADVRTTSRPTVIFRIKTSKGNGRWIGETNSRGKTSTPEYATQTLTVKEFYAMPDITDILNEDSEIDFISELQSSIAEIFEDGFGEAYVSGNNVEEPRGILSYDFKEATKQSDFVWDDLKPLACKTGKSGDFADSEPWKATKKLVNLLHRKYKKNAYFVMNQNTYDAMQDWTDKEGKPLLFESFTEAGVYKLHGYPIKIDDFMPDINNTEGKPFIIFGDIKQAYAIRNKRGIKMKRFDNIEVGHTLVYATARAGACVKNFQAYVGLIAKA